MSMPTACGLGSGIEKEEFMAGDETIGKGKGVKGNRI